MKIRAQWNNYNGVYGSHRVYLSIKIRVFHSSYSSSVLKEISRTRNPGWTADAVFFCGCRSRLVFWFSDAPLGFFLMGGCLYRSRIHWLQRTLHRLNRGFLALKFVRLLSFLACIMIGYNCFLFFSISGRNCSFIHTLDPHSF